MKYLTAITTLLSLNIITVISVLYLSSKSKEIKKENELLEIQISKFNKQLKINEVEFNLHTQRNYLNKLQKIYFDINHINLIENSRISLKDFENNDLKNLYMISSN